jgi:dipeptidase
MCDTLIATRLATSNNIAIFGKNSDRPPNEGQYIAYFPATQNAKDSRVRCTYIEIPQERMRFFYPNLFGCGARKWASTSMAL